MVHEPFLRQRFIKIRRSCINIFFGLIFDIMLNFC
nr:MAG TPA: hypothetical protein [Microviridae sp.]